MPAIWLSTFLAQSWSNFRSQVHTPWLGNRDAILDAVEQFLTGTQRVREPERLLATVLFADIVGSTERVAAIGDNPWRELLNEFYVRSAKCCSIIEDGKSARRAMDFLPRSTAPLGRSAVLARSVMPCDPSA